jgi:hypothetical protein
MRMSLFRETLQNTNSTMSLGRSTGRMISVLRSKFVAMNAMALAIILVPHSTKTIDSVGHQFHVQRIDAVSPPAQMIDFQIARNGSDEQFVTKSVGSFCFALNPNSSVTRTVATGDPTPASRFQIDVNFRSYFLGQKVKAEFFHNLEREG